MALMAGLTVLGLLFLYWKLPKDWRERIKGMDHISDVVLSVGVVFLIGTMTATFSGMMVGVIAGVMLSVTLYLAKRTTTHQTLEKDENGKFKWKRVTPKWKKKAGR